MGSRADLFELLQVSPRADPEVISAAYRVLMKKHYPNGISGDDRVARALNEAHQTLTDPKLREEFEKGRKELRGKVVGDYRVLQHIADGGFGTTYLGEHILTGMPVCIKHCTRISPEYEAILFEETCAVWDLRHFAIPVMRGLIRLDDGSLALVMSYVPGPTLEQIVRKHGALDPEHVAWITERNLNALKYLHFHGVVHGDVKPGNIIIQPEDHTVVLVDYGLSSVKPTISSNSKGFTPDFASPEEMVGAPLLPESDLYSLGITMLYALNGDLERVRQRQIPVGVPDELRQFIRELIKNDPLARPHWGKVDLCEQIQAVRLKAFGRTASGMKPIPGF